MRLYPWYLSSIRSFLFAQIGTRVNLIECLSLSAIDVAPSMAPFDLPWTPRKTRTRDGTLHGLAGSYPPSSRISAIVFRSHLIFGHCSWGYHSVQFRYVYPVWG